MEQDGGQLDTSGGSQNVCTNVDNMFAKSQCWPRKADFSMPR